MADVFISYAREDRIKAEHIAHGLAALGLECFWDGDIPPGQTWSDYIEGKLSQCRAVIVLWSEHSTKSQWVREEARMGREKAKLIPVMLDGAQPPFGFGEVQAADLSRWNGDYAQPEWKRFAQAAHLATRGDAAPSQAAFAPPPPSQPAWQASATPSSSGWRGQQQAQLNAIAQFAPLTYVQKCLRLYADGGGRARRSEYWWWALFYVVAIMLAMSLDMLVGGRTYDGAPVNPIITGAVWLALLAPGVSVTARRLHDIGLSGWFAAAIVGVTVLGMALSTEVPLLGELASLAAFIATVAVGAMPSASGANAYGPNPKAA
ncbi:MAG: TIR domain-containing protein [Vitreimonas sp.]